MILNIKRKLLSKFPHSKLSGLLSVISSLVIIFVAIVIAAAYLIDSARAGPNLDVSGRADARFRVYYFDNDIFPTNPIPPNLHFLMSFTDFIEVESRFIADFSQEVEVYYTFTSSRRFVIRHMATGDANLNPIVYEMTAPMSIVSGRSATDALRFPSESGNGTWNMYTINPKYYREIYVDFVEAQRRQMQLEGVVAQDVRGFSAELFLDFEYRVYIPEWGMSETVTQGYRLSLSTEVYSMVTTGIHSFNSSVTIDSSLPQPTFLMIVAYVLFLCFGVYGLLRGYKGMKAHPNPQNQMTLDILRKYSNEIVVLNLPLSLTGFTILHVNSFEPLLRLAINLNKHIMGFHDNIYAEFAVLVDGYAYVYQIYCNVSDDESDSLSENRDALPPVTDTHK